VPDEDLPAKREERYQRRRKRLKADEKIHPARRDAYLDRTPMNLTEAARLYGVSTHRISETRGGRRTVKGRIVKQNVWPHPGSWPPPDGIEKYVWGKPVYFWERGRLIEHGEKRGNRRYNVETGEFVKKRTRVGRPRLPRTTRTKRQPAEGDTSSE
jgi:hypothetical protein